MFVAVTRVPFLLFSHFTDWCPISMLALLPQNLMWEDSKDLESQEKLLTVVGGPNQDVPAPV